MQNHIERDYLIAWALIPSLGGPRRKLLLDLVQLTENKGLPSAVSIAGALGIPLSEAEEIHAPLRSKDRVALVKTIRDDCITLVDSSYPGLLRETSDPPMSLQFRGRSDLLSNQRAIAVVGSRRASPYAVNVARYLARELAQRGITVVSGLARGVDTAAHQAALEQGGPTIAVLGCGVDVVYPRENRRLYEAIIASGLVLSEHPPGTPPRAANFPARNRIIAGLTTGTIIVEATGRSGSLITARLAAEEGRDVFAVPGPVFSAGSEGTHRLIQYGAKLVHDIGDVLDELPVSAKPASDKGDPLLALLNFEEGRHVDDLALASGITRSLLAEKLLSLELDGAIRALPGSRYVKVR